MNKLFATLSAPFRRLWGVLKSIWNAPAKVVAAFSEGDALTQTLYVLGGVALVFALLLLMGLLGAFVTGGDGSMAEAVSVIRDVFIILLAVQGMLVSVALIVLVLQLAATVNLLQNELSEVAKNLKETTSTVKGTSQFLSENISAPVIESQAWLAGLATFVREARGVWKATSRNGTETDSPKNPAETKEETPNGTTNN